MTKAVATTLKRLVRHVAGCQCNEPCGHCGRTEPRQPWECGSCKKLVGPCAETMLKGYCQWCVILAARRVPGVQVRMLHGPQHLPECGTMYRGCAPDCPFDAAQSREPEES